MPLEERPVYPLRPRLGSILPFSHAGFLAGEAFFSTLLVLLIVIVRWHPGPLVGETWLLAQVKVLLHAHPQWVTVLSDVESLSEPLPVAFMAGAGALLALALRRWLDAPILLLSVVVTRQALRYIVPWVARPGPGHHHVLAGGGSFPASDVTALIVILGMLLFLCLQIRRRVPRLLSWPLRPVLAGLLILTPFASVAGRHHWPSDVLGGLLLAAVLFLLYTHLYCWLRHRFPVMLSRPERNPVWMLDPFASS